MAVKPGMMLTDSGPDAVLISGSCFGRETVYCREFPDQGGCFRLDLPAIGALGDQESGIPKVAGGTPTHLCSWPFWGKHHVKLRGRSNGVGFFLSILTHLKRAPSKTRMEPKKLPVILPPEG